MAYQFEIKKQSETQEIIEAQEVLVISYFIEIKFSFGEQSFSVSLQKQYIENTEKTFEQSSQEEANREASEMDAIYQTIKS